MTKTEFWKVLEKGKGKFKVYISGCIRTSQNICPISFVGNIVRNETYWHCHITEPAESLKLDVNLASVLANAADNLVYTQKHKTYRRKLLKVLGLKENAKIY